MDKKIQILCVTFALLVINFIQAGILFKTFSELKHTKQILTATVDQCGQGWIESPIDGKMRNWK